MTDGHEECLAAQPCEGFRRVALVEDDPLLRRALARLLATMDFDVLAFASAEEFLAHPLGRGCESLLLDLHLPGMSGVELLDELDRGGPLRVILLSSDGALCGALAAWVHGVAGVLSKPVDAEVLGSALAGSLSSPLARLR